MRPCRYCGELVAYARPRGAFAGGWVTGDGWGTLCLDAFTHEHAPVPCTRERPCISPHARARIKLMGLTDHRVAEVLSGPEVEYASTEGRRVAQAGELAVVFVDDPHQGGIVVVTVLPRTVARYVRPPVGDVAVPPPCDTPEVTA